MKCEECDRDATYYSWRKRRLVSMPDHPLCSRCYRAMRNRLGHLKGPVEYPVRLPAVQPE